MRRETTIRDQMKLVQGYIDEGKTEVWGADLKTAIALLRWVLNE